MTAKEKFRDILGQFDTAMLITRAPDGCLHGRPMEIARTENDGDLWFVTSIDSPKVEELEEDDHVLVTFQSASRYLTVSGRGRVERDRNMVQSAWRESWRVWFPEGKEDPKLALVHVRAEHAEYWDRSGVNGLRYAFEAAKAVITGERPQIREPKEHGDVRL